MSLRQIHALFSFRRLLLLILSLAVSVQLIVIIYNHFSGYYVLDDLQHFVFRLLRGITYSVLAGFLISYPDLFFIHFLNRVASWGKKTVKRVVLQVLFSAGLAILISTLITLLAHTVSAYTEDIFNVLLNNALIYTVVNIFLMAILEGWIAYLESRKARQIADQLQAELSQIRFEVLKSQINPHFMFNSLNVLSGLIDMDTGKAQQFIDEFSSIYRYVLESIEKTMDSLSRELDFARSYLFLQQIRYGKDLSYSVHIDADLLNLKLPPLSLQVVLENATKHNIVNSDKPLHIDIMNEGTLLVVRNNLQPKISVGRSTGLGLKNMLRRYALITDRLPEFIVSSAYYIVKLPLVNTDTDEGSDC